MKLSENMKQQIETILKERNVKKATIFGSFARGDATENSDLDLIVEPFEKNYFELAAIKNDLEENLNRKINLITYNVLNYSENKDIKKKIDKEKVNII